MFGFICPVGVMDIDLPILNIKFNISKHNVFHKVKYLTQVYGCAADIRLCFANFLCKAVVIGVSS